MEKCLDFAAKTEQSIIGSSNWYDSNCLDILPWVPDEQCGIILFASRCFIYFVRLTPSSPDITPDQPLEYQLCPCGFIVAHHERITGVAALKFVVAKPSVNSSDAAGDGCAIKPEFVTCGQDGFLRIWSYHGERQCLHQLNLAVQQPNLKPTCLVSSWGAWDGGNELIIAGTETGHLVIWDYLGTRENQVQVRKFERDSVVHCVARDDTVAVGYKRGLVVVYVTAKSDSLRQLHRIKAHDNDVTNLAWNPVVGSGEDLASASRDRTVKVWSLGNSQCLATLKIPNPNLKRGEEDDLQGPQKKTTGAAWVSLCWTSRGHLVVSNSQGDLGIWTNRTGSKLQFIQPGSQGKCHSRQVFGIREFSGQPPSATLIVSTSLDRVLSVWRLVSDNQTGIRGSEGVAWMPTVGGFIYSISGDVLNGCLAVGCGDNMIRLWRVMPGLRRGVYDVSAVWQGLNGRVTSLAWHPSREGLLAYGTDDGRVGSVYTLNDRRAGRVYSSHHKGTVFVTVWGPPPFPPTDQNGGDQAAPSSDWLALYSVGNYQLLCHANLSEPAIDFGQVLFAAAHGDNQQQLQSPNRTEISFRLDFTYFAVSNDDGSVEVFAFHPLKLVCRLTMHKKSVNALRWNSTNWLTVASHFVSIHDLSELLEKYEKWQVNDAPENLWTPPILANCLVKLEGHGNRVTGLDWSPHDGNRLVSASFDGTASVWDIPSGQSVANFRGHNGRLFCCFWSRYDPDLVYTGGEDSNLFSWRPSTQTHKEPPKTRRYRAPPPKGLRSKSPTSEDKPDNERDSSLKLAVVNKAHEDNTPAVNKQSPADGEVRTIDQLKELAVKMQSKLMMRSRADSEVSDIETRDRTQSAVANQLNPSSPDSRVAAHESIPLTPKTKDTRRKRPSLLTCTLLSESPSIESRQAASLELARYLKAEVGSVKLLQCLSLFGRRRDLIEQMEAELAYQLKVNHTDNYFILLLWLGRAGQAVQEAIAVKYLPDWLMTLMTLSSCVGRTEKRLIDEKVGQILDQQGDVVLAATYYLICQRCEDAVNLLKEHKMLREALLLASLWWAPQDPLRAGLLRSLAEREARNGSYEVAARCYLVLESYQEASQMITRRQTPSSFWTAAMIMWTVGEIQTSRSAMISLINYCFILPDQMETWRDKIKQSEMSFYGLLLDLFQTVFDPSGECNLASLFDMLHAFPGGGAARLSALEDDLLAAAITRQRSFQWSQVFAHLIYDIFLALYQSEEGLEMAPSRLYNSLQACAALNRVEAVNIAQRLLSINQDSSNFAAPLRSLIQSTTNFLASLGDVDKSATGLQYGPREIEANEN